MTYNRRGLPRFPPKLKELKRSSALALNFMDIGLNRDGGATARAMAETAPKANPRGRPRKSATDIDKVHGAGPRRESKVNADISDLKFNGKLYRNARGAISLGNGRFMRYGVGPNGACDFIGYQTVTVTPEMVGSRLAIFLAVEGKAEDGAVRPEQHEFIAAIKRAGGKAGIARSGADALAIIESD